MACVFREPQLVDMNDTLAERLNLKQYPHLEKITTQVEIVSADQKQVEQMCTLLLSSRRVPVQLTITLFVFCLRPLPSWSPKWPSHADFETPFYCRDRMYLTSTTRDKV